MRVHARLRAGRILTRGARDWLRRVFQMHAVAAICLAPLIIIPKSHHPFSDGRILGLFGLHATGWVVATDLLWLPTEYGAAIGYLAQFAITVIVVRDTHRRLASRAPRMGLHGMLGLALLALGGIALFATLAGAVVVAFEVLGGLGVLLALAVTLAQGVLGATFWLALPAAAVDGHGILPGLRRSQLLSHGSRASILGLIVMLTFLEWVLLIPFARFMENARAEWLLAIPPCLFLTLKACVLASAYHEACFRKEGPRADEVVEVFS